MNQILTICIITPILAILCWKDCKYRQLPNVLTFGLAALCLIWRFWQEGVPGLIDGLLGGIVCALFLLIPFLMKGAGGGDLKMLFATGIVTGLRLCFAELLFVSLSGLALGLIMMIFGWVSSNRLKHYLRSVFDWRYDRKAGKAVLPEKNDERSRVPFGVAIAAGTIITLLYAYYLEKPI